MKPDALSILESAYAPASSLDAWLARLVAAAAPVLDRGVGVVAYAYSVHDDGAVALTHAAHSRPDQSAHEWMSTGRAVLARLDADPAGRDSLARLYPRAPRAGLLSELAPDPQTVGAYRRAYEKLAARPMDALGIVGGDPSGHGVVAMATGAWPRAPGPRERVLWTRVAAHLASAYRLQRHAHADADAVLHPDGRVAHAEPAAQSPAALASLRAETRAIDRARGPLRRAHPDEALAVWKGLVAGQWSLVDQVDSDGRRYVFARRNAPEVRAWHALSDRERQVVAYVAEGLSYKATAYALGVSPATVSTHLRRAAQKVGADSRLALVRAYTARGRDAG